MTFKRLIAAGLMVALAGTTVDSGAVAQDKLKFYVNFIGGPEIQIFAVVK